MNVKNECVGTKGLLILSGNGIRSSMFEAQ